MCLKLLQTPLPAGFAGCVNVYCFPNEFTRPGWDRHLSHPRMLVCHSEGVPVT
jgi:hypothetical protein